MKITSIEPIVWKIYEPMPGEFLCYCCQLVNATKFIHADLGGEYRDEMKLPACEKCAEYAKAYPTWLEEMLFVRRMKAAGAGMQAAGGQQ